MRNPFLNIVVKELREMLRDPRLMIGMIVVPLLIFPLMGSVVNLSMDVAKESATSVYAGYLSFDKRDGNATLSDILYQFLTAQNISLVNITADNATAGLEVCRELGANLLLEIPVNFTERIANGSSAKVNLYQMLKSFGIGEAVESGVVSSALSAFNDYIVASRMVSVYPDAKPAELLYPLRIEEKSVIKGSVKDVPPSVVSSTVLSAGLAMPMVIMILLIMAGQLAATSVAIEKEQKTLEVLLTLPINRIYLLFGKITGVVLLSIIATASYLLGFSYYMTSLTSNAQGKLGEVNLASIGLVPDAQGYLLMMLSLFLAFLSALSISVLLGAYTKDVRSAQSLMGLLYLPIIFPVFILMMLPVEALPAGLQALVYGIPFSYPILASKSLYTQDYRILYFGIGYQVIFTVAMLYIAGKLFASEKILTAKIELKKKRGVEE
ncbi:MAG: ABC transporter permease [Thermoplasmata archaeon]|nr:ABC transporter permease [Thermoplasmata archaeon]